MPGAPHLAQGQLVMVVDQGGKGRLKGFFTHVPRRAPGQLLIRDVRALRHLLQAEITGMRQDAGIEMGQQRGPQRIGTGRMHKVVGEMRPGIHFNQQLTEFHLGKAGRDEVLKGFGAGGPVVGFQRRQNQLVVLDADMTVFASQELLDLGHTGFEFRLPLDQTLQSLTWVSRFDGSLRGGGLATPQAESDRYPDQHTADCVRPRRCLSVRRCAGATACRVHSSDG